MRPSVSVTSNQGLSPPRTCSIFGGGGDDAIATAGADLVESAAVDHDAAAKLVDGLGRGDAGDFDEVGFLHAGGCLGESVGELAVVGHQQQALGEVVEPADGVEAGELARRGTC